jgi:hypothetical protein
VCESLANFEPRSPHLSLPSDETVGVENADGIFAAAKHPKSFDSMADADHLLNRRGDAVYVAHVIVAWAKRYLEAEQLALLE